MRRSANSEQLRLAARAQRDFYQHHKQTGGWRSGLLDSEQALRMSGVTASEIAAVAGLSPWQTPLRVYLGKVAPDALKKLDGEDAGRERMFWFGHADETTLAERYAVEREREEGCRPKLVALPTTLGERYAERGHSVVVATPDRAVDPGTDAARLAQFKVTEIFHDKLYGDAGTPDIPVFHAAQLQWEMLATGYRQDDLAVRFGSYTFARYPVAFDKKAAEDLLEIARRFWRDHVVPRRPPAADTPDKAMRAVLARLTPQRRKLLDGATPAQVRLALREIELATQEKEITAARETLRNRIRQSIGTGAGFEKDVQVRLLDEGGREREIGRQLRVTWSTAAAAKQVDWEALARHLKPTPAQMRKFVTMGEPRRQLLVRLVTPDYSAHTKRRGRRR